MRSNFGQLMAVINAVNQAGYNAEQAVIKSQQAKGEYKLAAKDLDYKQIEKQEELKLRDRDYALKVRESARLDTIYKDVAMVVGIGLAVVVGIIGVAAVVFSKKSSPD